MKKPPYNAVFFTVLIGLICYACGFPVVALLVSMFMGAMVINGFDTIERTQHAMSEVEIRFDALLRSELNRKVANEITTCSYFVDGPEGSFFAKTVQEAEEILSLLKVDADEWTITDITTPAF